MVVKPQTESEPEQREELPRGSYFAIEKLIQDARLQAIRLALAASEKGPLTRDDMRVGLTKLVESGLTTRDDDRPIPSVTQDSYFFLEKRLHNLRLEVIRWAARLAREQAQLSQMTPVTTEQYIQQAWETIQKRPSLLRSLLIPESDSVA